MCTKFDNYVFINVYKYRIQIAKVQNDQFILDQSNNKMDNYKQIHNPTVNVTCETAIMEIFLYICHSIKLPASFIIV